MLFLIAAMFAILPASAATTIVQSARAQTAAGNVGCTVSGATVATPSVITCTAAHLLQDGDQVQIINVGGTTTVNTTGFAKVTSVGSATTFGLYTTSALTTGVTGTGSYTSGGTVSLVSDISAITGDFTVRLVVSGLTAAKNVVLSIQDSVDGYATSVNLAAVNLSGAISTSTPQTFTWRAYQLPSLRINTSNGRIRLSVQSIDGSASVTSALYFEQ